MRDLEAVCGPEHQNRYSLSLGKDTLSFGKYDDVFNILVKANAFFLVSYEEMKYLLMFVRQNALAGKSDFAI